jgi:hypothetical protein
VTSTISNGEISVHFSIEPTSESMVSRDEHRAGRI